MRGYVLYYKICIRITLVIEDLYIDIFHHVDAQGEKVNNICVLEYLVKGSAEEIQFKVKSHGNAKDKKKPFFPIIKTVIEGIRSQQTRKETLKETLQQLTRDAGGVLGADSSGSIVRSRQQIYDARRLSKPTSSAVRATQDSFADCLRASKEQEKDFMRLCQAHPEELYVVYDDRRINDLARFCTSPIQSSLMSIDPTFDFGKFAVTPITTHHLMLKSRQTGNHPT